MGTCVICGNATKNRKQYCGVYCRTHRSRTECKNCGAEFRRKEKTQEYCSPACWYESSEKSKSELVPCAWCGAELVRPPNKLKRNENHFCDVSCQGKYVISQNEPKRLCIVCNEPVMRTESGTYNKCCSEECRKTRQNEVVWECSPWQYVREKLGEDWARSMMKAKTRLLSKERKRAEHRANPWVRKIANTMSGLRKRARQANMEYEVNEKELYEKLEKQEFRCALSGRNLTPENSELDHIIPVSKGGKHTLDNLQFVRASVNRMKGELSSREFIRICRDVCIEQIRKKKTIQAAENGTHEHHRF